MPAPVRANARRRQGNLKSLLQLMTFVPKVCSARLGSARVRCLALLLVCRGSIWTRVFDSPSRSSPWCSGARPAPQRSTAPVQECDYRLEAQNQLTFRKLLQGCNEVGAVFSRRIPRYRASAAELRPCAGCGVGPQHPSHPHHSECAQQQAPRRRHVHAHLHLQEFVEGVPIDKLTLLVSSLCNCAARG